MQVFEVNKVPDYDDSRTRIRVMPAVRLDLIFNELYARSRFVHGILYTHLRICLAPDS